ncbi:ribonucleotide reductase [Mycena crocata]|nr:ribonucleotide reductase [Mycena crocata]
MEDGSMQMYQSHKLRQRIQTTGFGMDPRDVDIERQVRPISSRELAAEASLRLASSNPAYNRIASHIKVGAMHKTIKPTFSDSVKLLRDGGPTFIRPFLDAVEKYSATLDAAILHLRDYDLTHAAISEMEGRYLGRKDGRILERIQHVYMRVALALNLDDVAGALLMYEHISSRRITLDPFTLLYAGTSEKLQASSFSMCLSNAPVRDMYDAIIKCALAVQNGAKVGIAAQGIPCSGRSGKCHHDKANVGLWSLMTFLDGAASFARNSYKEAVDTVNITVEPWHRDVRACIEFNNLHQNDLSDHKNVTATIAIPDLFMARVDDDGDWSLFCPRDVPDLLSCAGRRFDEAYSRYENSTVARTVIKARELWYTILRSMILTGGPSIIFRDNLNGKSNLPDVSRSLSCHSNLRTGVIDVLGEDEDLYPRNHLAIELPLFVTRDGNFDFNRLHQTAKESVYVLDQAFETSLPHLISMVDRNVEFRAIAIGQNGLADVFASMRLPYESLEAADMNLRIAETIYHGALEASCELAEQHGPYERFQQSPLAQGIMQYNFWDVNTSGAYDWTSLAGRIKIAGVRNAALIAVGPGGFRDPVSGFARSTDPLLSNLTDDNQVNPWLVQDLTRIGVWGIHMRDDIVNAKGSIQQLEGIPADIRAIYRTAWEIDPQFRVYLSSWTLQLSSTSANYLCELGLAD